MKKLISCTLALLMVLCLLPVGLVSAEPAGGNCGANGDNVTWAFDSEYKVLTISGTGAMANYDQKEDCPWADVIGEVEIVIVEEGVTTIGRCAFSNAAVMTKVSLPSTLTDIKGVAFYKCAALTDITFPEGLKTIGDYTFYGCKSLTMVKIPDSVTWMGIHEFHDCVSLETAILSSGLSEVNEDMFYDCTALKTVVVPEGPERLNDRVFYNCSALEAVVLPDSMTRFGFAQFVGTTDPAIYGSANSAVKAFAASKEITFWERSAPIGGSCGADGDNVTWSYDRDIGLMTISGNGAMQDFESRHGQPWHSRVMDVKTLVVEEGVTTIGKFAFEGASGITGILLPTTLKTINDYAFCGNSSLIRVAIPDGVETIGNYAFCDCWLLTGISLPSSVKQVGMGVFENCYELQYANLSCDITELGNYMFENCSALSLVILGDKVTEIGSKVFMGCTALAKISIPDSVKKIDDNAFSDCEDLIIYGSNDSYATTYAKEHGFSYVSLWGPCGAKGDNVMWEFDPYSGTLYVFGEGGMAPYGSKNQWPWADLINKVKTIIIEDGVTDIGGCAFQDAVNLTKVSFPSTLTDIRRVAFYNCAALTDVTFPEGLRTIGDYAFNGCKSLTSIKLPHSVSGIAWRAFYDCTSLKDVTLSNGLSEVGNESFAECTSLKSVIIAGGTERIASRAFHGCSALTKVIVPDSVTRFGDVPFYGSPALKIYGSSDSAIKTYAANNELAFVETDTMYIWQEDHGVCWATLTEKESGKVLLSEQTTDISFVEDVVADNCLTYGTGHYEAKFPLLGVTKTEGGYLSGYGPHDDSDENGFCNACGRLVVRNYKTVSTDTETLTTGNWLVDKNTTFDIPLTIEGSVNLYIAEGVTLTANKGIRVTAGNSLYVYSQLSGTPGKIVAKSDDLDSAAIGGWIRDPDAGKITLNDVDVYAKGSAYGAGIGGAYKGSGGTVTINGGTIYAESGVYGAGIGGGQYGGSGTIIIIDVKTLTAKGGRALGVGLGEPQDASEIYLSTNLRMTANGVPVTAVEKQKELVITRKPTVKIGDVNGDGEVDSKDRMALARYLAKWTDFGTFIEEAADINRDGVINANDRVILSRYLAKWKGEYDIYFK